MEITKIRKIFIKENKFPFREERERKTAFIKKKQQREIQGALISIKRTVEQEASTREKEETFLSTFASNLAPRIPRIYTRNGGHEAKAVNLNLESAT